MKPGGEAAGRGAAGPLQSTGTPDHRAAATALLWGPPAGTRRGPKPTLTLDVIANAGIGIADADGLTALTMQRLAEVLGVTKMALYRYVPGKVELLALMIEASLGGPPDLAGPPGGWRPALDEWARRMFDRFSSHPWVLEAAVGARAVGPHELGWMEQAVAALEGSGLDGGEKLDVAVTLVGHARTIAQQGAAVPDGAPPEEAMAAGIIPLLRDRGDRFPALKAAFDSAAEQGSQGQALDFGLARILDGVELLIAERAGGGDGVPGRDGRDGKKERQDG